MFSPENTLEASSMWTFTWMSMKNNDSGKPQKVMRFFGINQYINMSINTGCGNLQEFADLKTSEKLQCIDLLRHLALSGRYFRLESIVMEQCESIKKCN